MWVNKLLFNENLLNFPALFSAGADNKIIIWNLSTYNMVDILNGHDEAVYGLECLEYKGLKLLISGSEDGIVNIWNLELKCCIASYEENEEVVLSILLNPIKFQENKNKCQTQNEIVLGTGNQELIVLHLD